MPEPCYPRNTIPNVDLRAWTLVAGSKAPRDRHGYWNMIEAAIKQETIRPAAKEAE